MSKKSKLHQLTGQIKGCYPGQVNSKSQWGGQTFYCLDIVIESLFNSTKATLYAFPNLVSKEVLKTLEQRTYTSKKYLFTYEKRVRGWRLKGWEEIAEN